MVHAPSLADTACAMLSHARSDGFSLYSKRRSRWQAPRWLVLLTSGFVAGAVGLWVVQERYLPPRLSADASTQLLASLGKAESERTQLAAELAQARQALEAAIVQRRAQGQQAESLRVSTEKLREDLAVVVDALPEDPRGGAVAVRAARFAATGGQLDYSVVLSRENSRGGAPLAGQVQLVLSGSSAERPQAAVELKPLPLSLGSHEVLRGRLPLPAGFKPAQAHVKVLDARAGALLGTRLLVVR
jgi:multidrug efflux pump subunit AcrA (membrane-fusion protein)